MRNCAQAHAIALADQGKACSNAKLAIFMQRSGMKKILGKFEKSFLLTFLLKKVRIKQLKKLSNILRTKYDICHSKNQIS
jgi:hypothetical protein